MGADFLLVVRWWIVLFIFGIAALPLTSFLFHSWYDRGYFFSKAIGMAVVTYIIYALGTLHLLAFRPESIVVALFLLGIGGVYLRKISKEQSSFDKKRIILSLVEELVFFLALLLWSWVKGHEPNIRGLEKFMDYGFMKSVLNSSYFPAADMWYAGSSINYYYFGHMVTAVLTKLSGIDLAYTFNLMLASIFAFTATMSFSIGVELILRATSHRESEKFDNKQFSTSTKNLRKFLVSARTIKALISGLLTSFLVTLAGNMQTIYAFTQGYSGDKVKPFWELWWPLEQLGEKLFQGMNTYWYANATRFIPFTIHEFPSYSFVVSDVHGHVLSLPFVLLAIALLIALFSSSLHEKLHIAHNQQSSNFPLFTVHFPRIFYGFLCGILLMTNALDGPIYLALFGMVFFILRASIHRESEKFTTIVFDTVKNVGVVGLSALVTSLPFLAYFKSFVSGVGVNCPPVFLAEHKIGPFLFETVDKCQGSPLWMMMILWGFFVYCGVGLILYNAKCQMLNAKWQNGRLFLSSKMTQIEKLLLVFFGFSLLLIIFPEFFYFKDIYPTHFRSNTMFKLGYDAFILFSIVSGYTIIHFLFRPRLDHVENAKCPMPNAKWIRKIFIIFLIPQLFLVSIYPYFSVRSYFGELKEYKGLYGLRWLEKEYPDDFAGIQWINNNVPLTCRYFTHGGTCMVTSVILEADGDSYTDYERYSAFTGLPTVIGWAVHEWLWRGTYDAVAPKREEVRQIYESGNLDYTRTVLSNYHVHYVVVGSLERKKFINLQEWKFGQLGTVAFSQGNTTIYKLTNATK